MIPSTQTSGGHWVAAWNDEYFDSYGREPIKELKSRRRHWIWNERVLQSPLSSVCGQYCVYYLLHRARGYSMNDIVKDFTMDLDENDQFVYDFVREQYDLYDVKYLDTRAVVKHIIG